ncbi:Ripening-related protein grip22 [Hibiscus syriacus]|uniref:Ripening-related protein grip22 n=1 Tax=Hibiscus syriacus TaxID=106335 RepID=A0A6A3C3E1_HIBSY|nr:Ripening-related protein grip22 [Hibiscus syriacus]
MILIVVKTASFTIPMCSPQVSGHTKATLSLNGFGLGEDGGGRCECDNQYHNDTELIVALSTGWFNKKERRMNYINIHGNGKTVKAKVVDECDLTMGWDVIPTTITSLLVRTTSLMPRMQFGMP